jgi:hypothetical protein
MIILLKMATGFFIGKYTALYFKKHELSGFLGICLVVALTLLACEGIDYVVQP